VDEIILPANAVFMAFGLIFTDEGNEGDMPLVGVRRTDGTIVEVSIPLSKATELYRQHFDAAYEVVLASRSELN
jgi:hypothetical protein